MQPKITIVPVTPDRWNDLATLFGERGASEGCWCMFWRVRRKDFQHMNSADNREALHEITERGEEPGLLAYIDGKPVGWCSVGPRESYAALEHSSKYKRVDDQPVWSIVCFFMDSAARGQGLMNALIHGAVAYAKNHGAKIVEAYPTDMQSDDLIGKRLSGDGGYMGIASAFRKAGFVEAARPSETKIIMRYKIRR
ncbi:MAG TPA: GNAT family N-acetyltransferase [Anaerolineales bacterium]